MCSACFLLFSFFFLATRKTRRKSRTYGAVYRVANDRLIGHQPTQKRPLTTMACEPAHLFPSTGYLFTLSLSLSLSCLSISLRDTVQLNQHSGSAFDGSRSLQCSVLFECVCVGVGMGVGVPRAGPLIIHQNWCLDYLRWRLSCHHHPNQFVVSLICNGMYSFFFLVLPSKLPSKFSLLVSVCVLLSSPPLVASIQCHVSPLPPLNAL